MPSDRLKGTKKKKKALKFLRTHVLIEEKKNTTFRLAKDAGLCVWCGPHSWQRSHVLQDVRESTDPLEGTDASGRLLYCDGSERVWKE